MAILISSTSMLIYFIPFHHLIASALPLFIFAHCCLSRSPTQFYVPSVHRRTVFVFNRFASHFHKLNTLVIFISIISFHGNVIILLKYLIKPSKIINNHKMYSIRYPFARVPFNRRKIVESSIFVSFTFVCLEI